MVNADEPSARATGHTRSRCDLRQRGGRHADDVGRVDSGHYPAAGIVRVVRRVAASGVVARTGAYQTARLLDADAGASGVRALLVQSAGLVCRTAVAH